MLISDWSSDVCSSDLHVVGGFRVEQRDLPVVDADHAVDPRGRHAPFGECHADVVEHLRVHFIAAIALGLKHAEKARFLHFLHGLDRHLAQFRSEEHTSELQSLMRSSYAVFCLTKKTINNKHN